MLPLYKKFSYGMGRFGSTFLLTVIDLTVFYFYGDKWSLDWRLGGAAIAMSYIVIGLTHWLTGYRSDQTDSRYGRRKPYVIIGAPGLAISTLFIFIPNVFINTVDPSIELLLFAYLAVFICLAKFFYAFLLTAYQAWMPEITDPDERAIVSSMENVANWIANGLGIAVGFFIALLFVGGPPPGLSEVGLSIILGFSMATVLLYIPSILWIREKPDIVIPERNITKETKIVLGNKEYVGWMLAIGFLSFAFSGITAQVVGFAQEVLRLDTVEKLAIPAIALVISILGFLFIWIKGIARLGKGKTMMIAMICLAVLLALFPIVARLVNIIPEVIVGVIFFVPLAACMAVYYLMSYIVPADIAHVDEILSGQSRAGMYEGFKGVPYNFFQALSILLLGFIMEYSISATGGTAFGFTWWAPLYAPFLILTALVLRYINIDPDFKELEKQAAKKKKKPRKRKKKTEEVAATPKKRTRKKKS
jgi:GPH family glycoside/pentoside/hexuronide:cation symporter